MSLRFRHTSMAATNVQDTFLWKVLLCSFYLYALSNAISGLALWGEFKEENNFHVNIDKVLQYHV